MNVGKISELVSNTNCFKMIRENLKDKHPVPGMIQRGGQVIINMLSHVRKATIKPFIMKHVAKGTQTYIDECSIYNSQNESSDSFLSKAA